MGSVSLASLPQMEQDGWTFEYKTEGDCTANKMVVVLLVVKTPY